MKDIVNFFAGRRYSQVSQSEMQVMDKGAHKSLQNKPTLNRGVSVVDEFFHDRKGGKRTRKPKGKSAIIVESSTVSRERKIEKNPQINGKNVDEK